MLNSTNKWIIRPNVYNFSSFYEQKQPYFGSKPTLIKK